MIFVSVGTQLPFDRLIAAVDAWAAQAGRTDVVAQIGQSSYTPKMLRAFPFIAPREFRRLQQDASLIVAHAGIGSILGALEMGKPILILPRDPARGEHCNAHQLATAERFKELPGIYMVRDEKELQERLDVLATLEGPPSALPDTAPQRFILPLKAFIDA